MNLVLIGYRGTGKSTVGSRLAQALQMPLVSLDQEIVRQSGKSINELVAEAGWDSFRALETDLVRKYSNERHIVLDCGGGVVEREANFAPLRASGTVFWLAASVATVLSRISDSRDRPALVTGKTFLSEVEEVLTRRMPLYARMSHVRIDTDTLSPAQVAERIRSLWPLRGLPASEA